METDDRLSTAWTGPQAASAIIEASCQIRMALAELERVPKSVATANVELFLDDALRALGVQP